MSSSSSPCAACKLQRRKCTQECVFAPYFPPDQPQKFANIHKVFGASNVSKLLNELNASQREDAVNSLAYEAEYRLRDPVYGCVGLISLLQQRLKQVQRDLNTAKRELANYIGPNAALAPFIQQAGFMQHPNHPSSSGVMQYNMQPMMMGLPTGIPHSNQLIIRDHQQIHPHPHPQQQQQQLIESHQLMIGEADLIGSYEQQHQNPQQFDLMRFNGFESGGGGPVTATGFHQMNTAPAAITPSLALGAYDNPYPIQQPSQPEHCHPHPHHHDHHQIQLQPQLLLQQQQPQQLQIQQQQPPPQPETPQQQQQRAKSDEGGGRSVGPLC
nr:lateral organ boundaries domain protein 28 [Ipomoea batatas]